MLNRLDRIQIAVPDSNSAASTFETALGAVTTGEGQLPHLAADKTVLSLGDVEVELLQPTGAGPVQHAVDEWGGGLFAAGFSTNDIADAKERLIENNVQFTVNGDRIHTEPLDHGGVRVILSPTSEEDRPRVGLLKHIYEVTNPVSNLKEAVDYYTRIFGLDSSGFQPIGSDRYGYTGTLTLFDPPDKLDRFEVTQITDYEGAMGRFHKRRGDSLYMCFAEVDDFGALRDRLDQAGVQYALDDSPEEAAEPDVLFIYPRSLCGMLMGVSLTGVAWRWSSGGAYH